MPVERKIDVKDQVTLSFKKSFRFCAKGISYRLFRSSLTLAVVVVAVAFFTVLLIESMILRSTAVGVAGEMDRVREADHFFMHVFHPYSSRELSEQIAGMRGNGEKIDEFAKVAVMPVQNVVDLVEKCHVEQLFLNFFRDLAPGRRVVLVKKNTGRAVFEYLSDSGNWVEFTDALTKMRSVRLPADRTTLESFIRGRDLYMRELEAARDARSRSVAALAAKLSSITAGADSYAWLAHASDGDVELWRAAVEESGFLLGGGKMERIRTICRIAGLEGRLSTLLQTDKMREAWRRYFNASPSLEEKLRMLKDARVEQVIGAEFSAAERAEVADRFLRVRRLRELSGKLPSVDRKTAGKVNALDGRQMFLVVISFAVCMVGITNAMLMSITERFREIATMKCLGATDGFILKQFLIEAAIQGVAGGVAGMLIGLIVSVLKSYLMLGIEIFKYFPFLDITYSAVLTVLAGVVLAMMASIYPSRAAATMAPMDAMRVE